MVFNSLSFLIFLPVVFFIHWALPKRLRWALLLVASYWFYMSWNAKYVVLILLTTTVSYACGLLLERLHSRRVRRALLGFASAVCLGMVFLFKYFNFLSGAVVSALNALAIQIHPVTLKLLLPVGISFYTFQTLSYVADVYSGRVRAERHFGKFALFVSFFPQLVAGPIERTSSLLPQLAHPRDFDYALAAQGARIMLWGFFKKVLVADTLAGYVDRVYSAADAYSGGSHVFAALAFAAQIYCDFSGYSDIAIGTARLFGVELRANFRSPYLAATLGDFWKRWHISLSTWFRDYVYIPLGGSRRGKRRHAVNLLITFLASGLWHGANWTFVAWGALHGAAQVAETFLIPKRLWSFPAYRLFHRALVFGFCVMAWVFFRARNVEEAVRIVGKMFRALAQPAYQATLAVRELHLDAPVLLRIALLLGVLIAYDVFSLRTDIPATLARVRPAVRWSAYVLAIGMMIHGFLRFGVLSPSFIYFQF